MKKILSLLFAIMIIAAITSCADNTPTNATTSTTNTTVTTSTTAATNTTQTTTIATNPPILNVIAENQNYKLLGGEGKNYLVFNSPQKPISGGSLLPGTVIFSSLGEMKDKILNNKLLEYELQIVSHFPKDENGIKIVNFPVNVYYPEAGGRISHYRKILDTCRIIKVHLRLLGRRIFRK